MLDIEQIRTAAQQVGLDDIGIVHATYLAEDAVFMDEWVERLMGREAERLMGGEAERLQGERDKLWYLRENRDKRYDPRVLVPGTQTILVGVLTFAHSGHDYHRTMKSKLYALEAKLKEIAREDIVSADHQHVFCDSAPFLERRWAERAGLGFIGKNHAFIHSTHGSLVHLGELCLSITLPLYPSTPLHPNCGTCRLCIDACPRGVLGKEPWDVTQCIAYETNHCLICQECCPFNR